MKEGDKVRVRYHESQADAIVLVASPGDISLLLGLLPDDEPFEVGEGTYFSAIPVLKDNHNFVELIGGHVIEVEVVPPD